MGQGFLAETSVGAELKDRIFGLDGQVLFDSVILACAVLFLFCMLSFLVFNPARELLRKRREKIENDLNSAAKDKEEALAFKMEYDARLSEADKEVEKIMTEGRKKAQMQEQSIVNEANAEAKRIVDRAHREAEQEKLASRDDMKNEIVSVASAMAGRFVSAAITEEEQEKLVLDTLKEMGDGTWQE